MSIAPTDLSAAAIPAVKQPDAPAELLPAIHNRWSPRAFLDKPVPPQMLRLLLEAARWAASCFNEQPWRYVVATRDNPQQYETLLSILVPKNQLWAKAAPVLMLSVGRRTLSHNNKPNPHYLHDVGAASATMAIQAASMGLAAHAMGGYDAAKARTVLNIPEDFDPGAAIAIGYPAPADAAPAEFQAGERAPRMRKALPEIAFAAAWGMPLVLQ